MRLSRPCNLETFFMTSNLVSITCCSGPRIDSRSGNWNINKQMFLCQHQQQKGMTSVLLGVFYCVKKIKDDAQSRNKGKVYHVPLRKRRRMLEFVGEESVMSVTDGQCNSRPTVTFPAARHHCPLAGTKLYCLVSEAHVCYKPGLHSIAGRPGFEPTT